MVAIIKKSRRLGGSSRRASRRSAGRAAGVFGCDDVMCSDMELPKNRDILGYSEPRIRD